MEGIGESLHDRLNQPDGEGGAPILGDEEGDGDRDREMGQRIGAGFESEAHGNQSLLRTILK